MRVIVALPGNGLRGDSDVAAILRQVVEDAGHQVLNAEPPAPERGPSQARIAFERDFHLLQEADLLVADLSAPSFSVGWMIAWFLAKGRLVVCTVPEAEAASLPPLIQGNPSPWQRVLPYKTPEQLRKLLAGVLTR